MADFQVDQITEILDQVPSVVLDDLNPVFDAIRAEIDAGESYDVKVGAIWDRKGYPNGGSVSDRSRQVRIAAMS